MRKIAFALFVGLVAGCHPSERMTDEEVVEHLETAVAEGRINFANSIDVASDGTVFVGYEQSPDGANPYQPAHIFCYGGRSPGWQGTGCYTALPVYDNDGEFQGFGQVLPPDGPFRMGFGNVPLSEANWFNHSIGLDTPEEWKWAIEFEECGTRKINLCARMIDGVAQPAQVDCLATYVEPPSCD